MADSKKKQKEELRLQVLQLENEISNFVTEFSGYEELSEPMFEAIDALLFEMGNPE